MAGEYLGDSVYIYDEHYGYRICTNNGGADENNIILEPDVVRNLINYLKENEDNGR